MSSIEVLQLILIPSLSLILKLPTVFDQTVNNHVNEAISSEQAQVSTQIDRRRRSLFGLSVNENVVATQNKYFPRWAKMAVCGSSFTYCIMLITTVIVQGTSLLRVDGLCNDLLKHHTEMIWHNGCKIKNHKICKNREIVAMIMNLATEIRY